MKQLTVISGKGGTGKTSITAALASLVKNTVFVDCDVDAADLHLILKPTIKKTIIFIGLKIALVNELKCNNCKRCVSLCNFNAINDEIKINYDKCEGCGLCSYVCPVDAIEMVDRESGYAYISETRFGPMAHAMLKTAEEASGKLVTLVRNNAKNIAEENNKDLILIDGPPGTGCPVIASITGVDLVLIITEPTLSGIHDLERIYDVALHFKIPAVVCINKFDINLENTKKIEEHCKKNNIVVIGKIPYDTTMTRAMVEEKNILEYSNCEISIEINNMWEKIIGLFNL